MITTNNGEVIRCRKCRGEKVLESQRYSFKIRKEGAPVGMGIISMVECLGCKDEFAFVDTTKDLAYWLSLEGWPDELPSPEIEPN